MHFFRIFILMLLCQYLYAQQIKSPSDFLPSNLGEQFTPHHLLADYFEYVADQSQKVQIERYGETYENRPLFLAFISSPENLANLENIRKEHLRSAGLIDSNTAFVEKDFAVVWLSYSVHGNEAGGSEASMNVLYELVAGKDLDLNASLENTIIILDPCLNPDGYSRYSHWYIGNSNKVADPNLEAREHQEPWPGGRLNHYNFDLNRDWAWASQKETQQRLAPFQRWMPHVHADVHEQFKDNPYYFAPAAAPFHMYISDWQREFQTRIGKDNASLFNDNEWLYFTREVFDLLYPSYGDTYPTFNGSIGMTYEQAGHGFSGRSVKMENGDTLTLQDRIDHHTGTSLTTIKTSSKDASALKSNFSKYFKTARENPPGKYKSFVISTKENQPADIIDLCSFLDLHGIEYGGLKKDQKRQMYNYQNGQAEEIALSKGDLIISAYQTKGILAQVLFEPSPELEDSLTYDITAWSIPHAWGLSASASEEKLVYDVWNGYRTVNQNLSNLPSSTPYAVLLPWTSLSSAKALGQLLKQNIGVRFAEKPFSNAMGEFGAGTLVVTAADNRKVSNWYGKLKKIVEDGAFEAMAVNSGWSDSGADLGSDKFTFIQRPKVLLLSGEGMDANAFGFAWHYFEEVLDYPATLVNREDLGSALSDAYNVLLIPESYGGFDSNLNEQISAWVRKGGRLIAVGNAIGSISSLANLALGDRKMGQALDKSKLKYGERERAGLSNWVPGAIYKVELDETHPLSFGLGTHYFTLKTNSMQYGLMSNAWNVGVIGEDMNKWGFAGYKFHDRQKETMVLGHQPYGRGSIIFLVDDPLYRGFWRNGQQLFANALFLCGQ